MFRLLLLSLVLSIAGAARAADLTVEVRDTAGRPVPDAVVIVHLAGGAPAGAARLTGPMVMSQHDIAFDPHVLIVPVGSDVSFPNKDTVRHHVYSFSPAKKFELKLYGRDESRSVHFDKPGPVALGCNIHDRMSGFVYVVDTPYAARSGPGGTAVIRNLPGAGATLTVWHPYMKAPRNQVDRALSLGADLNEVVVADIRPPPPKVR